MVQVAGDLKRRVCVLVHDLEKPDADSSLAGTDQSHQGWKESMTDIVHMAAFANLVVDRRNHPRVEA